MSCELALFVAAPATCPGCAESTNPSLSCVPPRSRLIRRRKERQCAGLGGMHHDFCEVAVAEDGRVRSAGRLPTRVSSLELFAQSLVASDVVALEATSGTDKIVGVLQRQGIR